MGFVSCCMAATGAFALTPVTRKRGGGSAIRSPWLAHTVIEVRGSNPANSPAVVAPRSVTSARPYSRSADGVRSEEHTSELQSPCNLVCRLLLEKKKTEQKRNPMRRSRTKHTGESTQCVQ